jgi:phenylalanyl-tRNA synthetase beta chain
MAVANYPLADLERLCKVKREGAIDALTEIGAPIDGEADGSLLVEVTPNRPDLLSVEGGARALDAYVNGNIRKYSCESSGKRIIYGKNIGKERPYVGCFIVNGVDLRSGGLVSLMQLQEKLHDTLGRKRKKVAIGVHNLDAIEFPVRYDFAQNEKFVPLGFDREMDCKEILEEHPKGKAYAHIVKAGRYPMMYDAKGPISFPPIINTERTKLSEGTKNLLVDVTGTSKSAVWDASAIIACALIDRGGAVLSMECAGTACPDLKMKKWPVSAKEINAILGMELGMEDIRRLLARMCWVCEGRSALCQPYRNDVLGVADMAEDVAVAYGYNKFVPTLPEAATIGRKDDSMAALRQALAQCGFVEVSNYVLINRKMAGDCGMECQLGIMNPKTEDFTHLRPSLAPSLLASIAANKTQKYPIMLFEAGHAYDKDREHRNCAFAICGDDVDFARVRGVAQSLAKEMGWVLEYKKGGPEMLIPGRAATLNMGGKYFGFLGEVSPEVLGKWGIPAPVAICEFRVKDL